MVPLFPLTPRPPLPQRGEGEQTTPPPPFVGEGGRGGEGAGMTTRSRKGPLLPLPLDPAAAVPLFRQLYEGVRRRILDGTLPPGVRLPASRSLAGELGLSRNTVVNAYEQLLAEGYLEGKV